MEERIPLPKMSEFLLEEFMKPLNLAAEEVSDGAGISLDEINGVLSDKREMTLDVSRKLGEYFGVSAELFYDIQQELKARAGVLEFRKRIKPSVKKTCEVEELTPLSKKLRVEFQPA